MGYGLIGKKLGHSYSPQIHALLGEYEYSLFPMEEEGVEHEFEVIDTLEDNDTEYLGLIPIFDDPQSSLDDDGELVILKVVYDEEADEEFLEPILDDEEYDRIADMFMDRLGEFFDFEE